MWWRSHGREPLAVQRSGPTAISGLSPRVEAKPRAARAILDRVPRADIRRHCRMLVAGGADWAAGSAPRRPPQGVLPPQGPIAKLCTLCRLLHCAHWPLATRCFRGPSSGSRHIYAVATCIPGGLESYERCNSTHVCSSHASTMQSLLPRITIICTHGRVHASVSRGGAPRTRFLVC
jgi:hypothetical protein